jgi:hypothetical protein
MKKENVLPKKYHREIGRSRFPSGEWGNSSAFGKYGFKHRNYSPTFRESDSYDGWDDFEEDYDSYRFEGSREGNRARFADTIQGDFSGIGPKGYKRSKDSIREDVCEALYRNPFLDASGIEVEVLENGIVHLKGSVDSRSAKREAESCIENLPGVEDIKNDLNFKRPISYKAQ